MLIILFTFILASCGSDKTELKVINAGSLMVPFAELEAAFEAEHPDVDVQIEGHGSIQVIRHVTELYAEPDVIAVADYSLLPMMMYDVSIHETDEPYANWQIKFATNRLGIAYTPSSKHAEQINGENWYKVLSLSDVTVGISDPRFDSCGYRSLMLCQLAELHYDDDQIFDSVIGDFDPPINVQKEAGNYRIIVPEILRPQKVSVRGSSVALLGTIQSGDIDYAFMYESVSKQHGLEFIELPVEIDLSSTDFSHQYGKVKCSMGFQRFSSVVPEFQGETIIYGITIPGNSTHTELASEFIEFILGPEGQRVLMQTFQPALIPPETDLVKNMPVSLQYLIPEG